MTDYKKQHWVPSSYLQFFDREGRPRGRESTVWVTDGDKVFPAKIENLSVSSYTYSASAPAAAEESFHNMEGHWPRVVERITRDGSLDAVGQTILLLQMLDMHFRNPRYEVVGPHERIGIFRKWSDYVLKKDIAGYGDDDAIGSREELAMAVASRWSTAIVRCFTGDLLTCDNPAFLHQDSSASLDFGFMPISPDYLAVCYRKSDIEVISGAMNDNDAASLNGLMAAQTIRHMYSRAEFDDDDVADMNRVQDKHYQPTQMSVDFVIPAFWKDLSPMPSFMRTHP